MERFFEIGKITGTHGIKGAFKVFPTTDDPSRYKLLKEVIIKLDNDKNNYKLEKVSFHKQFIIVKVNEIDDINVADKFKGAVILIPEKDALPLGDDEYYIRDLYDMEVVTEDGETLGVLNDIYKTGANDVYSIIDKNNPDKKELLIPAIKQCILNVDINNAKMIVRLLEGLR